jgi:8-oxo-dGTP pyrophosphatase MutT (NUDIX family)
MKKAFVCGFLMTFDLDKFLLIDKGKKDPEKESIITNLRWCGLGGEVNEYVTIPDGFNSNPEHPHDAMVREFREESGYEVKKHRWFCFMVKEYQHAKIYMYISFCSPDEMLKIKNIFPDGMGPEGQIQIHNVIDLFFDPEMYTHDLPYLMNMIVRESRRGFITKLDPEGVNTSARQVA